MGQKRITLRSGDSKTIRLTAVNSAGTAVNITGYTLKLKIASDLGVADNESDIELLPYYKSIASGALSDPANGIHDELITKSTSNTWVPGEYMIQARWIDASGEPVSTDVIPCTIVDNLIADE